MTYISNITTTASSTANCVIQTDNVSLMKTTGGTIEIGSSGLFGSEANRGYTQITNGSIHADILTGIAVNQLAVGYETGANARADGISNSANSPVSGGGVWYDSTYSWIYNGTSWDRVRSIGALSGGTLASTGLPAVGNMNYNGAAWIDRNVPVINDAQYTTTVTSGTVWTPTGGKKFVMTDMLISTKDATSVSILDGTTKVFEAYLAANGGVVSNFKTPIQSTTADNSLHITTDTASTLSITTTGYEI